MPGKNNIVTLAMLFAMTGWHCIAFTAVDSTGFFTFSQSFNQLQNLQFAQQVNPSSFNLSEIFLANDLYTRSQLAQEEKHFDRAISLLEKAEHHFRLGGDWRSLALSDLQLARCYLEQSNHTEAMDYLQDALSVVGMKSLTTDILHAEIHQEMGAALIRQGRKSQSIDHFLESIAIRKELNGDDDPQLADTYNKLGISYYLNGEFADATKMYQKALSMSERLEIDPIVVAEIYNNIGILHKLNGDLVESFESYSRSLELKEALLPDDDPNLARTYNNLGNLLRIMGQSEEAMIYYQKAEAIFKAKYGSHDPMVGKIYTNQGIIFTRFGDYSKAIQYFNQALAIYNDDDGFAEEIASAYNNLGNVYSLMENYEKALASYLKCVSKREQSASLFLFRSYSNIALCYHKLGQLTNAQQYHQLSVDCLIKFFGRDHYILASEYINYGHFLITVGEKQRGLNLYQQSYKIYKDNYGEKHPDVSNSLVTIGDYYLQENDYLGAMKYYQQSLYSLLSDFNDKYNIYSNPNINQLILSKTALLYTLHRKAVVFRDYYQSVTRDPKDIQMSLQTFELAFELMDNIRIGHLTQESKLDLAKNQRKLFVDAIQTAFDAYKETGDANYQNLAFQFAERGKAAMLYDFIRENDAKHFAHIPDSLLRTEHKIKEDIAVYQRLIDEENVKPLAERDQTMLAHWEDKLFDLQDKQSELIQYFNVQYPKYYQYKYTNRIYPVAEIQASLNEKDVMIEYFLDSEKLYAFYLSKDKVQVVEKQIDSSFYRYIDALPNNQALDEILNNASSTYANYLTASHHLYRLLLEPFESDFAGKNLIIIPDGILGYISFESLLTDEASTTTIDYKNLPYLLRSNTINYGYSSTLYLNSLRNENQGRTRENLLAFAPVYFDKERLEDGHQDLSLFRTRGENLIDLPATLQEVKAIKKILGGDVYLNESATVERFKQIASNYRILHIATHGIVDNVNPLRSRLVFSPVTEEKDGACLRYNDLFNLDLNAEMAVLSACNTGYGQNSEGEGIIALSRGFLYSGVPSLVISLWNVEDESTALIMKNFYKYVKEGFSKDEALRRSKLDFLSTSNSIYSSPHFWSGFINIGNNQPLAFDSHRKLFTGVLLVIVIPLSLLTIFYNFRKARQAS
ncbi:MAG: CHAT domain-containing protein [Lentimicrobiaceae bacterium]|nr:CHAT domain-containing protein [Lentimicrobiaceae bacterium]